MEVRELTREQLEMVKQRYYCMAHDNVSYAELLNINELVSDEEIFEEYSDTMFVEDDF